MHIESKQNPRSSLGGNFSSQSELSQHSNDSTSSNNSETTSEAIKTLGMGRRSGVPRKKTVAFGFNSYRTIVDVLLRLAVLPEGPPVISQSGSFRGKNEASKLPNQTPFEPDMPVSTKPSAPIVGRWLSFQLVYPDQVVPWSYPRDHVVPSSYPRDQVVPYKVSW